MKKVVLGFLILPLVAGEIKISEIRSIVEELIEKHVDEDHFNKKIANRSFKNYIYAFDPSYNYFLKNEVRDLILKDPLFWDEVVVKYNQGDFSLYQNLNSACRKAVVRARKIREKVERKLLAVDEIKETSLNEGEFCSSEDLLEKRLEDEVNQWLFSFAKNLGVENLSKDQKQKVISFHEKKILEHESNYMGKISSLQVVKAIAKSLDAHTMYYSDNEASELALKLKKEFCGLGIQVNENVDGPLISHIIPHSPAETSGLIQVGDIIKEIDGISTDKISFSEVLTKLIGDPHSTVLLTLLKKDGAKQIARLNFQKIVLEDERVKFDYEFFGDGIVGFITVPSFYDNGEGISVESDLKNALLELKAAAPLKGLILDMRNNFGGFLDQAAKVVNIFSKAKLAMVAQYEDDQLYVVNKKDLTFFYDGPLVILMSKATASAAELVAGVLQEEGLAIVVGDERSYGKGSMQFQTITDLNAKRLYKVSVGRYFTPSLKSLQINGVKADIVVPTVYWPLHIGEKYLNFHLKEKFIDEKRDLQTQVNHVLLKPYLKKKSLYEKMVPILRKNSAKRGENDLNLSLFYHQLKDSKIPHCKKSEGCGVEDLQKKEGLNVLKDMILINTLD